MTRRVTTYGLSSPDADLTATDVSFGPLSVRATIHRREREAGDRPAALAALGPLALNVPGRHNLLNALATIAVGRELGLSFERIAQALEEFRGAERRFEVRGEARGVMVVDDYGHHPTEIAAVIAAAKGLDRRIVVAFQPHRFSRTAALLDDFGPALSGADHVLLTGIYAAGEKPIAGVTIERLAESVRRSITAGVEVVESLEDVPAALARLSRPGDVVITLGAGSIGTVPAKLLQRLGAEA
jgi:UDP-N-acetylmuramate--alanine ligase